MSQKTRAKQGRRRAPPRRPTHASSPRPTTPCLTFTATELATLSVDRTTSYDAARRGEIPSVHAGRCFLFPRAAIDARRSDRTPARGILGRPVCPSSRKVTKQ